MARRRSPSHLRSRATLTSSGVRVACFTLVLAALLCSCGQTKMHSSPVALAGDAAWHAIGLHADIRGLAFTSAKDGWAVGVGDGGCVFSTSDGGRSWDRRNVAAPGPMEAVDFVDSRHGWVVGAWHFILATTDGGTHWDVQQNPFNGLSGVSFVDPKQGWLLGSGNLAVTTDGGATWKSLGYFKRAVWVIDFVDAQHGWAVGDGNVQATADGGVTWHRQLLPKVPKGWWLSVGGVKFTTDRCGWLVGDTVERNVPPYPEKVAVLHTTDGGATWKLEDTAKIVGSLSGVYFADVLHGWAVGSALTQGKMAGIVVATDDGGMTWHEQVRGPAGSDFKAVAFSDARHGCVAGGQLVLTTASGGKS